MHARVLQTPMGQSVRSGVTPKEWPFHGVCQGGQAVRIKACSPARVECEPIKVLLRYGKSRV